MRAGDRKQGNDKCWPNLGVCDMQSDDINPPITFQYEEATDDA